MLIGVRRELTPEQLSDAASGLVATAKNALRTARCVAAYNSIPPEPGTGPLIDWLTGTGARVLLPVLRDDNDLGWGEAAGNQTTGRFGLTQPAEDLGVDEIRKADVVLVPALAVDRHGTRLGRGGGSYDRALTRVDVPIIALIYDTELVDELPSREHDQGVAFALTPTRMVSLAP